MNINNKNLCGSCFAEIDENQTPCPVCGYAEGSESKYPTALPVGTVLLGQYIIGKTLGKGGFGVTYLAYDSKEDKKVAVKEYLPDTLTYRNPGDTLVSTFQGEKEESFQKGVEKFYEEAQMVSRFNGNPGLIWVYKFFYENQTAYFVMEYLEGSDLKDYIQKNGGVLNEEQVLDIALPLIDSLIIVHSIGVLHRDMSPDNIYMTNDGKIKLLDFGAARQVIGEASKSLSVILKQGFAPIEQYQTRGKQGPWTDIYALGATIFYCLTGKVPDAPMDRLEEDNLVIPEGISGGFKEVLGKMMAVRAIDRYQDTMELKQDMIKHGLLGGEATVSAGQEIPATTAAQSSAPAENISSEGISSLAESAVPIESVVPKQNKFITLIKKHKIPAALIAACFVVILSAVIVLAASGGFENVFGKNIRFGGRGGNSHDITGTWVSVVNDPDTNNPVNFELALNDNDDFYLLMYIDSMPESFFIAAGTYRTAETNLILTTQWSAEYSSGDDEFDFYDVDEWNPDECSVAANTITLPTDDGEVIFTKGEPSGLWSFDRKPKFPEESPANSLETGSPSATPGKSNTPSAQSSTPSKSSTPPKSSTPSTTAPKSSVTNQRYTFTDPYMQGASGVYTGGWKDGKPNGNGTLLFDKSFSDMGFPAKYTGAWSNGNKHGQGTATWKDGSTYVGAFVNNKKHGKGKLTNSNGSVYWDGEWKNDEPVKDAQPTAGSPVINFPDKNFEAAVREVISKPTGEIKQSDVAGVAQLELQLKGISNLTGIEYFTNLKILWLWNNNLTTIDVSKNTKLESLNVKSNKLTSLNISKNTKLTTLVCSYNKLPGKSAIIGLDEGRTKVYFDPQS